MTTPTGRPPVNSAGWLTSWHRLVPSQPDRHEPPAFQAMTGRIAVSYATVVEQRGHRGHDRLPATRGGIFRRKITDADRILTTVLSHGGSVTSRPWPACSRSAAAASATPVRRCMPRGTVSPLGHRPYHPRPQLHLAQRARYVAHMRLRTSARTAASSRMASTTCTCGMRSRNAKSLWR
jgi:hypothetical protein